MTIEPMMEADQVAWGLTKRLLHRLYAHGACSSTKCMRASHDEFGNCRRCERLLAEEFHRQINAPMSEATAQAIGRMLRDGTAPHRTVHRRIE